MAEFKKHSSNNFWHSPLMLIVLFCATIVLGYSTIDLIKKENDTSKKKALILNEIKNLEQRENYLTNNINELKTEQGTEKVIRDKYQVVKPGEKMVMIVDDNKSESEQNDTETSRSFWQWLKGLF